MAVGGMAVAGIIEAVALELAPQLVSGLVSACWVLPSRLPMATATPTPITITGIPVMVTITATPPTGIPGMGTPRIRECPNKGVGTDGSQVHRIRSCEKNSRC